MEKCKRIQIIEEELQRITNLLENGDPEWHEWWNAETVIQLSNYRIELAGELCGCSEEAEPENNDVN